MQKKTPRVNYLKRSRYYKKRSIKNWAFLCSTLFVCKMDERKEFIKLVKEIASSFV